MARPTLGGAATSGESMLLGAELLRHYWPQALSGDTTGSIGQALRGDAAHFIS